MQTWHAAIESLFPSCVRVAVATPAEEAGYLYPEEEAAVARAVEKRRQEFRAGRACARRALASLGIPAGPIPVRANRAPVWPEGVVGSITHCAGFAAAIVAHRSDMVGVGIDAETADPLKASLQRLIYTEAEAEWARDREPPPGTDWGKVIFSAKEAVYKCVGPLAGRWIGLREVTLRVDADERAFTVSADPSAALEGFGMERIRGRYAVTGGLVLSGAVIANL